MMLPFSSAGKVPIRTLRALAWGLVVMALGACGDEPSKPPPQGEPRGFLLGLGAWPSESSWGSLQRALDYAVRHAEVVVNVHDDGIPWAELSEGRPLPESLDDEIALRAAASRGAFVFVATTPLNRAQTGLAPEWGTPSPPPGWTQARLADPHVQDAYTAWCIYLADAYRPQFLAVFLDVNVYALERPEEWSFLVQLYQRIASTIRQRHPGTAVFPTFRLEYLTGEAPGTQPQWDLLDDFGPTVDFAAVSIFPSLAGIGLAELDVTRLVSALQEVHQRIPAPLLIAATGYPSESTQSGGTFVASSEEDQRAYLRLLVSVAEQTPAVMLVWSFPYDFPGLLQDMEGWASEDQLEPLRPMVSMGLNEESNLAKAAAYFWDETWLRPVVVGKR
jgi:hypothetical protein